MRTIELDAYVVDTLMADLVGHDHQPSAFLVYLYLWRRTRAEGVDEAAVSLRQIAEGTGISRRAVQDAVARLAQRQLIGVERASITAVPRYRVHRPWARWMDGAADGAADGATG
ncbi:MAG TPA: helix-turn-helix domain-containing protein [Longimicrobium sp.]